MTLLVALVWLTASLQSAHQPGLPCVYWDRPVADSVDIIREAGIDRLCVPLDLAQSWRAAGLDAVGVSGADLASRKLLPPPGIAHRADLVSATRSPWLVANGWQFLRAPQGRFTYELTPAAGALAAAEAFAYGADAILSSDAAGIPELGAMLAFLRQVPAPPAQGAVGDLGVVDDGSEEMGEVLNLLSRRNLLFEFVKPRDRRFRVTVALGSARYPREKAADPSAFARAVRRELTDQARTIRIYGSEAVICRVTRHSSGVRVQLLNYGGREIQGLRVRLRGTYRAADALVSGVGRVALEELVTGAGVTEVSLPRLTIYASVDLTAVH
jgi:hypothetical protein